jgi:hypothetical protein
MPSRCRKARRRSWQVVRAVARDEARALGFVSQKI